ncbi:MAG: hypothetical protein ACI8RD_012177 [Bacillariaceae sp.]|jgi:hypothetical protein
MMDAVLVLCVIVAIEMQTTSAEDVRIEDM